MGALLSSKECGTFSSASALCPQEIVGTAKIRLYKWTWVLGPGRMVLILMK